MRSRCTDLGRMEANVAAAGEQRGGDEVLKVMGKGPQVVEGLTRHGKDPEFPPSDEGSYFKCLRRSVM